MARRAGWLWLACALAGLGLLVSSCGGSPPSSGVANITSPSATKATATAKKHSSPNALAYAQCMRKHGVSNFPDPNSQGRFALGSTGIDKNSPVFQSASTTCQALKPQGIGNIVKQNQAAFLKFSACMRSHGEAGFPDISAGGGTKAIKSAIEALDPSSPAFQTALSACRSDLPTDVTLPGSATAGNSGA